MFSSFEKGRHQKDFINRNSELQLINNAFDALVDNDRLLNTPIIDFFGVDGIGKTSVLRQIQLLCDQRDISCIWLDANDDRSRFLQNISEQMQMYTLAIEQITDNTHKSFSTSSAQAIKKLLAKKPPVVVLLDSVDVTSEQQSDWIETMLRDVIEDTKLCVVLASKQKLSFERDWSMARKLTLFQLKPLDHAHSELYLSRFKQTMPDSTKNLIFEWTHGYPLAMDAMLNTITENNFDLEKDEDQRKLVDIISKRVIDDQILAKVEPAKLVHYRDSLALLSFPRRFNLLIIQELFTQFAPSLASEFKSKLAYMALPGDLKQNTNVLYWDPPRAGFTIDQAVRHIFLLKQKIEQKERFIEIHAFLAQKNKELMNVVTGSDRMRYLREYLYHSICSVDAHALAKIVEEVVQKILPTSTIEEIIQFIEEFAVDEDLHEALGSNVSVIDTFIEENKKREG